MMGGLFSRNQRKTQLPPPPKLVEPPLIPSPEKRQEKERRWIESISSRNINKRAGPSSSSHPPLPAPVEFIKRDQPVPHSLVAGQDQGSSSNGFLHRWSTPHKRGNTAGSSIAAPASVPDNRSLRTTRSASALASRIGLGRRSKERNRQKSSSSSLLSDCIAAPSSSSIPHTPPLLQLGSVGGDDTAFVHVPQFSPSSALLVPPSSSSTYFSAHRSHHGTLSSPASSSCLTSNLGHSPATSSYPLASQASSNSEQPLTSSIETTKTLAARLQELEHAHSVGLLDDEEYRVLRQNLFEKNVKTDPSVRMSQAPLPPLFAQGAVQITDSRYQIPTCQNSPQRTGTLLGLPRLNMADSDTRGKLAPLLAWPCIRDYAKLMSACLSRSSSRSSGIADRIDAYAPPTAFINICS